MGWEQVSRTGRTIVVTIHQPGNRILSMFDKLYLIRRGQLMYYGPPNHSISVIAPQFASTSALDMGQLTLTSHTPY